MITPLGIVTPRRAPIPDQVRPQRTIYGSIILTSGPTARISSVLTGSQPPTVVSRRWVRPLRLAIRATQRIPPDLCPGYTEIYALIRSTLGWNQIFNTKAFSIGPLTNIEFIVGGDYNVDNTTEGSAKRDVVGGLQFDFQTPYKGSLTVGVMAYQEWQHDGFAAFLAATPGTYQIYPNASGNVRFDPTWDIEINYTQPLGDTPFTFRSVATIHGQKGCGEPCGFGAPGYLRTNEYFTQQQLVFDVGKVLWNEPQRYVIFGAYRWWDNKFGIAATQPINGVPQRVPGAIETGWSGGAAMKF
jgi:nucleoside-specific outer membrane channel protein Tsx